MPIYALSQLLHIITVRNWFDIGRTKSSDTDLFTDSYGGTYYAKISYKFINGNVFMNYYKRQVLVTHDGAIPIIALCIMPFYCPQIVLLFATIYDIEKIHDYYSIFLTEHKYKLAKFVLGIMNYNRKSGVKGGMPLICYFAESRVYECRPIISMNKYDRLYVKYMCKNLKAMGLTAELYRDKIDKLNANPDLVYSRKPNMHNPFDIMRILIRNHVGDDYIYKALKNS
jgi:hypothetical protein